MNIYIIAHSKDIYIKYLTKLITPHLYDGIHSIYEEGMKINKKDINNIMTTLLQQIDNWDNLILGREVERIKNACNVEILDDLIKVIIVNYCKVLLYPNNTDKLTDFFNNKIQFSNFVHNCYKEISKELIKNPNVICNLNWDKYHKIKHLIEMSIQNSIENMIPLKIVLKSYMNNDKDTINTLTNSKTNVGDNIMKMIQMDLNALNNTEKNKITNTPQINDSTMSHYVLRKVNDKQKESRNYTGGGTDRSERESRKSERESRKSERESRRSERESKRSERKSRSERESNRSERKSRSEREPKRSERKSRSEREPKRSERESKRSERESKRSERKSRSEREPKRSEKESTKRSERKNNSKINMDEISHYYSNKNIKVIEK